MTLEEQIVSAVEAAVERAVRRAHDLRRTGISLARSAGADAAILRWGTHAPPKSVIDLYTSIEWEALCREVGKLRLELHWPGVVVALPVMK